MRTSLNEISETEEYLTGRLSGPACTVFQAKMIVDQSLRSNVSVQQMLMGIIALFHRRKLREEVKEVHDRLFADAGQPFAESIHKLFNS